jgi:hypothetical protein
MSRDFDGELVTIAAEMDQLRQRMADARDAWMGATAPWLAQYWPDQTKAIVVDQADRATEAGAEAIRSIRAEVEDLAGRARSFLWSEMSTRSVKQPDDLTSPKQLDAPMRKLESEVLPILNDQGFRVPRNNPSSWYGTSFRPLDRDWTREMVDLINVYAEHHGAYLTKLTEAATIKREKAQSEAANLWDS